MVSPLGAALSLSQPMVSPAKAQIAPTDVLGAYNSSVNQANTQYLAKLQQQNALWGGLAGLGGSALTAGILKGNLFGPAAGGTTPLASGAALPDLGREVFTNGVPTGIYGAGPFAGSAGTASADAGAPFAGVPLAGLTPPAASAPFAGAPLAGLAPPVAGAGLTSSIPAAGDVAAWTTPGLDLSGAGYLTAGGDALASAAPEVAADTAATTALGAGTADTAGMTLADLLPFLFA